MKFNTFWLLYLLLTSCGKLGPTLTLGVVLELPNVLSRETARYKRFLDRVDHLLIRARLGDNDEVVRIIGREQWSGDSELRIFLPPNGNKVLFISAQVWDRTRGGRLRTYPVLHASKQHRLDHFREGQTENIRMKLSLEIAESEYD